jgi:hypothetical protein
MKAFIVIAFGIVLAVQATAQTTATSPQPSVTRDPQALSLLSQSLAVILKGRPIQDVKLQAQVTRSAGSTTDTGAATLEAAGYDKSNVSVRPTPFLTSARAEATAFWRPKLRG